MDKGVVQSDGGIYESIDEGVFWWFGHMERIEKDRIAKKVYVGEYAGSCSLGRLWKRWIDTAKECIKKNLFYIRQARRMVGVFEGEHMGHIHLPFMIYSHILVNIEYRHAFLKTF